MRYLQGYLGQFKNPDTTEDIKSALKGEEYYGINISEERRNRQRRFRPRKSQIKLRIFTEDTGTENMLIKLIQTHTN